MATIETDVIRRARRRAVRLLAPALVLAACACTTIAGARPQGEVGPEASDLYQHQRIPPELAEGQTVARVHVHLRNPSGDPARDEEARRGVAEAFGIRPGGPFNPLVAEGAVRAVRALPFVAAAELRTYSVDGGGQVAIALLVDLRVAAEQPAAPAAGALATRKLGDLPLLWEDERSLLKLIVNPAFGAYVDRYAWLGNAGSFVGLADQNRTLGVVEASLEVGIGGITRLGSSDAYAYGAASYVGSTTLGEDIYTDDSNRAHGGIEDLYGGILIARKGSNRSFNLSAGRQKFSLNRNLQIGHVLGASNGDDRAAANLSPRNAYDMTVDARLHLGRFVIQGWLADPDELPARDSRSRFVGLNLKYNDNESFDASLMLLGAIRSDGRYPTPDGTVLTRDGLRVVNPRIRWNSAFGVEGLWLEADWAHQWNTNFDMSADGGGIWTGYTFTKADWRPAVLYRWAVFTGDDPTTGRYERFDSLTGGVQRDWAQGFDMIKVVTNRNIRTHRVELSVKPTAGLDLSLDYYYFTADKLNNLGGQPPVKTYASSYLGQELTPTLQWMIGRSLYVQALATFLIPGDGIRDVLPEPAHVWQSYQLSFYFFF